MILRRALAVVVFTFGFVLVIINTVAYLTRAFSIPKGLFPIGLVLVGLGLGLGNMGNK